jgi:hypothetical protein
MTAIRPGWMDGWLDGWMDGWMDGVWQVFVQLRIAPSGLVGVTVGAESKRGIALFNSTGISVPT